ncbi:protein cornichon homolog 1 [Cajanus cajan]|uniref:protein cornichon homolog 1 n=1 Tax=Cajanus cajan TaxID=3821 RepID=UPI00098DD652|nr:protein cornichon homolog 1 [Cajanus cajan]
MGLDLIFWLVICFPLNVAFLASAFYQVLILSDLESDFVNPYDASSRINYFILPEFIGQGLFCALCLFTGHWIMFLLTVPVTCYHVMLYMKRQHLIDVTEVFRVLNAEKKFRIAKLAYYLTIIIITVFRLVLMGVYYLDSEDE